MWKLQIASTNVELFGVQPRQMSKSDYLKTSSGQLQVSAKLLDSI